MRYIVAIAAFLLALPAAFSDVVHAVDLEEDRVRISSELILISEEGIDRYSLKWTLPDGAILISIEDESGPIEDYTISGSQIAFTTNPDIDRRREDVKIVSETDELYDDKYEPFRQAKLSLPGFEDEKTTLTLRGNAIVTSIPLGFSVSKQDSMITMQGEGPVALFAYSGDVPRSVYYHNYNGDVSDAEDGYKIIAGTIGIVPYYIEFPVIFAEGRDYENLANPYSAGTYKTGGIILIKKGGGGTAEHVGGSDAATLLHETTHAYNDQIMNWKSVDAAWFDEGSAQYVEFLYRSKVGEISPELFGDPISYREGLTIYTYPSRGDREDLWDYYQNGEDWMERWSPTSSSSQREFGYAFSELLIRRYVVNKGPDALHDVYEKLSEVDHEVDSDSEFNRIVLDAMGTDMRPCYSSSREEFDACLAEVNDFNPTVLEFSGDLSGARRNDAVASTESFRDIETAKDQGLVKPSLLDRLVFFVQNLFLKLSSLLGKQA